MTRQRRQDASGLRTASMLGLKRSAKEVPEDPILVRRKERGSGMDWGAIEVKKPSNHVVVYCKRYVHV